MRSGTRETRAMLRNPPAVKGRMYIRVFSRLSLLSNPTANRAPRSPTSAVLIWALAASSLEKSRITKTDLSQLRLHLLKPDLRRMAKSPNS